MKTKNNMRYLGMLIFLLSLAVKVVAQAPTPPKNFASPNVESLGSFTDNIGVNLYTGSPAISVPLYTVTEGGITLPISLSYNSALVKPDFHPGWCGLGWNLNCGGSIKRTVFGDVDEMLVSNNKFGFYDTYSKITKDSNNWYTHDKLISYPRLAATSDVESDQFDFQFLNYSGRFMMGHDGKWHVISDDDIQLVFDVQTGFMFNAKDTSAWWQNVYPKIPAIDRYFNKFTLITPDGIKYEFGGYNAVEFSVDYREAKESALIATSWHLTRIITPQRHFIELKYERDALICTLGTSYYYIRKESNGSGFLGSSCKEVSSNVSGIPLPAGGFLTFPVYLKSIKTTSSTISLERSKSNELRYSDRNLGPIGDDNLLWRNYFDKSEDLQWQKLDKIKVKYNDGTLLKEFLFTYDNISTERLKLLSLQEMDKNKLSRPPYLFSYNENKLPQYHSDQIDHWLYYNGNSFIQNPGILENWMDNYTSSRNADSTGTYSMSEILNRITYPTQGFVTLEFEPHTYSKIVNANRNGITEYNKDKFGGGGLRIKKISSYTGADAIPVVREYLYIRNYNGEQNTPGLLSSGVLGGETRYFWFNYVGKDIDNVPYTYDLFSSNSIVPDNENASGSPIGYTEVTEITQNNGYIKSTYTNFDTQISGAYPHLDERAITYTDPNRANYSPYTSKAMERGKLSKVEIFNNLNQKVKEVSYTYTRSSSAYINTIRLELQNICNNRATALAFFGTAYKTYRYSFLLTSETEKTYSTDDLGNIARAMTVAKSYEYNSRKLIKKTIVSNGDGTELITINKYPTDYNIPTSEDNTLQEMSLDTVHVINPVIEQQVWKKYSNGTAKIIGGFVNKYGVLYLPASTYQLEHTSPSAYGQDINYLGSYTKLFPDNMPYVKSSDIKYDSYGNVAEIRQPGQPVMSYLYSYNHNLPVAKVANATNLEIAAALGYPSYYALSVGTGVSYTSEAQAKIESLRTLIPNARVTSATYNVLLGTTSIMDENGKVSYCEYDNFSRIQLIKDNDKNIIQAYRYNYKQ